MAKKENLALQLARRQKRLAYWQRQFNERSLSNDTASRCRELFSTFSLLMVKIIKAADLDEQQECEARMESIERELTSLFEARRLMCSTIGDAITPEPEPGEAGH